MMSKGFELAADYNGDCGRYHSQSLEILDSTLPHALQTTHFQTPQNCGQRDEVQQLGRRFMPLTSLSRAPLNMRWRWNISLGSGSSRSQGDVNRQRPKYNRVNATKRACEGLQCPQCVQSPERVTNTNSHELLGRR